MISHIVYIESENYFGQIDNPLWQVATLTISKSKSSPTTWSSALIPLEDWDRQISDKRIYYFQSYLSEENLKNPALLEKLNTSHRVQIWIDRIITRAEASILSELLHKHENLDLVYLPDLHFHPEEIFKYLKVIPRLLVHMNLKRNSYDRWLRPLEFWDRICWLSEGLQTQQLSTQTFNFQLTEYADKTEILFLLNPSFESLEYHLKAVDQAQYYLQSLTYTFSKLMNKEYLSIFRYICWATMAPTKEKWNYIYNWFYWNLYRKNFDFLRWRNIKNQKIFYPLRKAYWFCEYQLKKRILGNLNESSQRRDTSYKL